MKNKFIALLMILATFVILPCMAEAAESGKCGDDLTWTLDDNGTLVISGTGEMWDFGYTDEEAPPWCDLDIAVKKIKINDGATSISESAFRYLLSASEVSLPNSLLHIGRWAFADCDNLKEINIPASVEDIEEEAFFGLSTTYSGGGLTSINVDAANQYYSSDDGVLFDKEKTTLICYPYGKSETSYTIPSSVSVIDRRSFHGATALEEIKIPVGVTTIESRAFENCTSLKEIELPDSVESLGSYSFAHCRSMTSVKLSKSLYRIESSTFSDCSSLENIEIPDGVVVIEYLAFSSADNLKSITIPQTVLFIGRDAFNIGSYYWCALENVYYKGNAKQWQGITINDGNEQLLKAEIHYSDVPDFGKCGDSLNWEIQGNGLIISGAGTMYDYPSAYPIWYLYAFDTLKIESGVTSIGEYAFYEKVKTDTGMITKDTHLKTVIIPKSVTNISSYAFWDCDGVTDVYYEGSMAEWNKITIGDFNTCLTDANIHFNSVPDISFYEPLEVHTEYSVSDEGKVIFTISVDDSSRADELSGISLYAAEYENGMLTKVNAGIKGSISGNSIDITIDTPSSPNYKIMLWDRHLYPLMNAIENI